MTRPPRRPHLDLLSATAIMTVAAATLAGCGGAPAPTLRTQPTGLDNCQDLHRMSDGMLLAVESLSGGTNELLLNPADVASHAAEIDTVLTRLRSARPELQDVHAAPRYEPSVVLLEVTGDLAARIKNGLQGSIGPVKAFKTGDGEFDRLAESLGFKSLGFYFEYGGAPFGRLGLDDMVNTRAAADAFERVEGVKSAGRSSLVLFEAPGDIELRRDAGVWYAVFSNTCRSSDACPPDHQYLYYFIVDHDSVTEVTRLEAQSYPVLRELDQARY